MRRLSLILVLLLGAGCRSTPIQNPDTAALAAADAKTLAGCYDCLIEARDIYARVAQGPSRPSVLRRLFETEVLLVLRERALALDSSAALARARALSPELPATVEANRILRIVDDVPPYAVGTPARAYAAFVAAHRADQVLMDDDVAWLVTGPLRSPVGEAIARTIDCAYWPRPHRSDPGGALPRAPQRPPTQEQPLPDHAAPLVRFVAATCGGGVDLAKLEAVRTAVPAFIETSLFRGRAMVGRAQDTGPAEPRALLLEAYARFPQSPSVTYLLGNLLQLVGDCEGALRYFDETIALSADHENGWLGRTTCLSVNGHHEDGIASATHMIDRQLLTRDGYFWRAWNWRELKELAKARADIEQAKPLGFTADVYRLAGMIEHDQDDLGPAETDLVAVRKSSAGKDDCVARWYLGLVYVKGKRHADAGQQFSDAMDCYEAAAAYNEGKLHDWQTRTDVQIDPAFRASQIKAFQEIVGQARSQQYASAFNAANYLAQGGDVPKARLFLEIAAKDPDLADVVQKLRSIIK